MAANRTNAGKEPQASTSTHSREQRQESRKTDENSETAKEKENLAEQKNTKSQKVCEKVPKDREDEQHRINRIRHNTEQKQNNHLNKTKTKKDK